MIFYRYILFIFSYFLVACSSNINPNSAEYSADKVKFCNNGYIKFSNATSFEEVEITEVEPNDKCLLLFEDTLGIRLSISYNSLGGRSLGERIANRQLIAKAQGGAGEFTETSEESYNGFDYYTYSGSQVSTVDTLEFFSETYILSLDSESTEDFLGLDFSFWFQGNNEKLERLDIIKGFMQSFEFESN